MKFEELVIGQFNEMAVKASEMVSEEPGIHYPLLIIQGNLGSGKTSLMKAIESKTENKDLIRYTGEELVNALIDSIKKCQHFEFKERLRNCDILIVDDFSELRNKTTTQEVLWYVIKHRVENSKQTIATINMPIDDNEGLYEKIKDLLRCGLNVEIEYPNFDERLLLIKNLTKRLNLTVYDDVCRLIAENCKSNVNEIYGNLRKLKFYSEAKGIDINLESVGRILKTSKPMVIGLDNVLDNIDYNEYGHKLPLILGLRSNGELYVDDLSSLSNLLVTGMTGSGKSSLLHSFIKSLNKAYTIDFQLILIDMMSLEFNEFREDENVSYISNIDDVTKTLKWVKNEIENRNKKFRKLNVLNINEYETHTGQKDSMNRIIVFIEGLEHFQLEKSYKEIEKALCYIACRANTFGIHIIASTQRPYKEVITKTILAEFENRICLRVSDANESKRILNRKGAEKLKEKGEMFYKKGNQVEHLRGLKISDF